MLMLKGIDPLPTPELLKVLCEMGHGDEVVFADANFTAETLGRGKPVIRLPGVGLQRACAALLSVFPLDAAVARPVAYMKVCESPAGFVSGVQQAVLDVLASTSAIAPAQCEALDRFAFYERVQLAYAIVQTGEQQPWANFSFKKGVIADALT